MIHKQLVVVLIARHYITIK